ncbi:MAG: SRPBCC domain-containing protein [Acidimicrobiia bacterium]|nr:SRPBCC domain-containing protein [Acidimicrobiia bacterium]
MSDDVVIERTFDAPIEVVWQLWTGAEHFGAWYGPTGARITVEELDVRVGGGRRVCMEVETPGGPMRMWFTGEHLEVTEPRRLVYTESMTDEHGNVAAPPGHPATTEVRVELVPVDGGTAMVLTHVGVPAGSPGAAGWAMALDKLAARVATTIAP